jgi:hypothetical protein
VQSSRTGATAVCGACASTPCTHVNVCSCVSCLVTAQDVVGNVPACGCIAGGAFEGFVFAAFRRLGLAASTGLLCAVVVGMHSCRPCLACLAVYIPAQCDAICLCSRHRLPLPVAAVHALAGRCSAGKYALGMAPVGQVGVHGQLAGVA